MIPFIRYSRIANQLLLQSRLEVAWKPRVKNLGSNRNILCLDCQGSYNGIQLSWLINPYTQMVAMWIIPKWSWLKKSAIVLRLLVLQLLCPLQKIECGSSKAKVMTICWYSHMPCVVFRSLYQAISLASVCHPKTRQTNLCHNISALPERCYDHLAK